MAKSIKIELSSAVTTNAPAEKGQFTREGWSLFDAKKWDEATESFLLALEENPHDQFAAEGLTMTLFRSGDYASVVRLGQDLKKVMPGINVLVAKTVFAEVRALISCGDYEVARILLAHFPEEDADYREAHAIFAGADGIETALNANAASADPGTLAEK